MVVFIFPFCFYRVSDFLSCIYCFYNNKSLFFKKSLFPTEPTYNFWIITITSLYIPTWKAQGHQPSRLVLQSLSLPADFFCLRILPKGYLSTKSTSVITNWQLLYVFLVCLWAEILFSFCFSVIYSLCFLPIFLSPQSPLQVYLSLLSLLAPKFHTQHSSFFTLHLRPRKRRRE